MTHKGDSNRLAREKSPYLLQHAQNPVDWYPWGEEAFEKARRENKPIFLSIGYSTCHWCHVMAHESFESEDVAEVMNREFVNIKVDREERPDVDRVYMTFVQATTGHGGWPMSVWLTPELKPFVGGTYFPPEDRYGHPAFKKILQRIANAWKQDRDKIADSGEQIVEALREAQRKAADVGGTPGPEVFDIAFQQLERIFDPIEGGFGNAPKFPHPVSLNFLTRYYERHGGVRSDQKNSDSKGEQALEMDLLTLRKMAGGGMHDHLGGGFHRYSVDRNWHVPHFEKMLYDQAQLAVAYLEAFQITRDEAFASVVRDILDYVIRDMTSSEGGFFSAEDADSPVPATASEPKPQTNAEGAFYVWAKEEIDIALGQDAEIFDFRYGVEPNGNVREGSDPHDEFRAKNILFQRHTIAETAQHFGRIESEVERMLAHSRRILFEIRAKRPRPHLDDKILASWNGLMISAFARAGQVLDEPRYREAAARAAVFIRDQLYESKTKLLYRSFRHGRSAIEGFADDYAFVIQGFLDLYEASFDIEWLEVAVELQTTMDHLFYDNENGGYFSSSGKDSSVFLRMKDDNDSAEPAPSSIAALNLLRLAQMKNDEAFRDRGRKTIAAFEATLSRFPTAMPQMTVALDFSLRKPLQIVITGDQGSDQTRTFLAEIHRNFLPNKVLLLADGGRGQSYLAGANQAIQAMGPVNGHSAVFLCENFVCQAPVTDAAQLRELLGGRASTAV